MRSSPLSCVLFCLALAVVRAPWAAETPPLDCSSPLTTVAILGCLDQEYTRVDAALNRAYQAQRTHVDATGRGLLRDAQRRWLEFRDAECERSADLARGGSLARVLRASCLVELTRERVAQLQQNSLERGAEDDGAGVFWRDQRLLGNFACGEVEEARVGLVPRFNPDLGEWLLLARVRIGQHALDFPIGGDGQDALCGHDLTLQREAAGECPGLRLDDGMCDPIHLHWDANAREFVWWRE